MKSNSGDYELQEDNLVVFISTLFQMQLIAALCSEATGDIAPSLVIDAQHLTCANCEGRLHGWRPADAIMACI